MLQPIIINKRKVKEAGQYSIQKTREFYKLTFPLEFSIDWHFLYPLESDLSGLLYRILLHYLCLASSCVIQIPISRLFPFAVCLSVCDGIRRPIDSKCLGCREFLGRFPLLLFRAFFTIYLFCCLYCSSQSVATYYFSMIFQLCILILFFIIFSNHRYLAVFSMTYFLSSYFFFHYHDNLNS